jgi:uracil-DNA glycosylase
MHQNSRESVARELWIEMNSTIPPYPPGVVAVPEPIERTAFFPGGLGLWMEERSASSQLSMGQIMVVGQDFNTVAAYNCARLLGSEVDSSRTWQNLRRVLAQFNVPLECCFFTNVYMGLRAGGPETGRFPGVRDAAFVDRCIGFFTRQITFVRPKLVLTLGLEPLRALAPRIFRIKAPSTLSACDQVYGPLRLPHGDVTVVALTHPSLYYANVGRRRYAGFAGIEAEKAMVDCARSELCF